VNLKESCTIGLSVRRASWRGLMIDAELGDTPKRQRRDRIAWHERNIAGANTGREQRASVDRPEQSPLSQQGSSCL
jgi:hypothetical protein